MTAQETPKRGLLGGIDRRKLLVAGGALLGVVVFVAIVVAAIATAGPGYFSRYSDYARQSTTLATSAHKGIACTTCHGGGAGYRVALVADFYAGMFQKRDTPVLVNLQTPTNAACLSCHDHDWSDLASKISKIPHPAHLRVAAETRNCVDCHRWIGHEETYMQQHTKMPFSVVCASFGCHVGVKPAADCKNCHHQLQPTLADWRQNHPAVVRAYGPNACLEQCHKPDQCRMCHTTGQTPQFPGVINASTVSDIERAHVKTDWLTQHGAFALADKKKCLTCHVTFQECIDCHSHRPAFHGTDNTAWIGTGHGKIAKANPNRCFACHKSAQCNACHTQFQAQSAPQFPANLGGL